MHGRQICECLIKIIEWIVNDNLTAIWNIVTEAVLKRNFFFSGKRERTAVGTGITFRAKHPVIKKTKPCRESAVESL